MQIHPVEMSSASIALFSEGSDSEFERLPIEGCAPNLTPDAALEVLSESEAAFRSICDNEFLTQLADVDEIDGGTAAVHIYSDEDSTPSELVMTERATFEVAPEAFAVPDKTSDDVADSTETGEKHSPIDIVAVDRISMAAATVAVGSIEPHESGQTETVSAIFVAQRVETSDGFADSTETFTKQSILGRVRVTFDNRRGRR